MERELNEVPHPNSENKIYFCAKDLVKNFLQNLRTKQTPGIW
jgi:hypothetical protein